MNSVMKTYRVNNIFYSLQGEGYNTGRAAAFIRFASCNLRCAFCDTEFDSYKEMSAKEIIDAIEVYPARFVVLTGGEPTLQVDELLIDLLHQHSYIVAMESNGTRPSPCNVDWLTVSPKVSSGEKWLPKGKRMADEIKIVFDEQTDPETIVPPSGPQPSQRLYLQPCDTGDANRNAAIVERCVEYIKHHPQWRLSLQTHKLIHIE